MSAIDDLRALSTGETVRAETDEDEEYALRVVDEVDYVEPDEYGAGHLEVPVEFDGNVHAVPSDELPNERGTILARREGSDSLGRPKLSVRTSDVEEHTGRRVERWETIGWVESVEVADGDPTEAER